VIKVIVATRNTSLWPHFGGSAWVRLQYMLGLERLGIDAFWLDRLGPPNREKNLHGIDYIVRRFQQLVRDFGLEDRYCIDYNDGERYFGMDARQLTALIADADLLLNISGYLPPDSPLRRIPRKAYIDVDPGFTQVWALEYDMALDRHDVFFTTGQLVGRPQFNAPTGGIEWHPIVPPVALDEWPARIDPALTRFSTIADWWGSQDITVDGEWCGGKREEFLSLLRVPLQAGRQIDVALVISAEDHEDLRALVEHGWRVRDPYAYAGDPHSYREFVQASRAEFSVAKRGYVRTRCGWVSDRTACYLASGKPAIVQSTGFEEVLEVGRGLLTFTTLEEAVAAIADVEQDYLGHAEAARRLAEERFDSDVVLTSMLGHVGLGS
jgi:hypothetical protein